MVLQYLLTKVGTVNVGVNLCGRDAFMAQHSLYGTQVGSTLQQTGGKGMTKGVWGDILLYTSKFHQLLDTYKKGDTTEFSATTHRDEHIVLMTRFDTYLFTLLKPLPDAVYGHLGDGYQTVLVALAMHTDVPLVKIEIADQEVTEFADTQTATVECLDDGMIALGLAHLRINSGNDGIHLLRREHIGQVLANLGSSQEFGGVGLYLALQGEKTIETTHSAEDTCQRTRCHTEVDNLRGKLIQLFQRDLPEINALIAQIVDEFLQVADIGIQRVAGIATLETQILDIAHHDGTRNGHSGDLLLHVDCCLQRFK